MEDPAAFYKAIYNTSRGGDEVSVSNEDESEYKIKCPHCKTINEETVPRRFLVEDMVCKNCKRPIVESESDMD